jgi:hypothetical protein
MRGRSREFEVVSDPELVVQVRTGFGNDRWSERLLAGDMLSFAVRPTPSDEFKARLSELGMRMRTRSHEGRIYVWVEQR